MQISKLYENISEDYITLEESKMVEVFVSFAEILNKISGSFDDIKRIQKENMMNFFNMRKNELEAMNCLIEEWKISKGKYDKACTKLHEKKKEILDRIPINKWEIRDNGLETNHEILKGKTMADIMPDEVKEMEECKEFYGYYCNKIPEEFKIIWNKAGKDFRANFSDVSQSYTELFGMVWVVYLYRYMNGGMKYIIILSN